MLLVFSASLFLSAVLLFSVQPLFAKMVLPRLGGSPSVWSVLMVCFQAVLLAGYAYAHWLARLAPIRWGVPAHLCMLAVASLALPIAIAAGWGAPPDQGQSIWLVGLFAASVAIPFFAVSANAPLLQAWFARTGHAHAADPYFLYGASNIGSFVALLGYPVLVEPLLRLGEQSALWGRGYAVLVVLVALAGWATLRANSQGIARRQTAPAAADRIAPSRKAAWAALAFVPSGMLVAVTAHISTDVAAAPFLWVMPLALFLLTFVLIFRRGQTVRPRFLALSQAILVALYALTPLKLMQADIATSVTFHLALFFVSAMMCHGELYRLRPSPAHLTSFYLWMSAGGVLGGIFASLAAPLLFDSVLEYPLLVMAALLCRAAFWRDLASLTMRDAWIAVLALVLFLPRLLVADFSETPKLVFLLAGVVVAGLAVALHARPARHAAVTLVVLVAAIAYASPSRTVETARSFFGVHRVQDTADGGFRLLIHGTTIHGAQALDAATGRPAEGPAVPRTYYHQGGPLGDAVAALRGKSGDYRRVAVVGLGTGSLACHARPGERWSFHEIDAVVARLARDGRNFRFLEDCAPGAPVVLGDARLTLADEPPGGLDLLIVDAFSSDAIPVHLLTAEALELYSGLLSGRGAMVFHITNRHMELASVLAAVARGQGWTTYVRDSRSEGAVDPRTFFSPSMAAVLVRSRAHPGTLAQDPRWREMVPQGVAPWSDDYSDILSAIWRHYRAAP